MCGGFEFSKRTLIGLNIIYIFVAFLLIGVAAAAKKAAILQSLPVVGGIVACGVFLLFIAIVGLYGAIKQHQVALFFYMVVLFSIFVIQFSVACASLAASTEDELEIMEKIWNKSSTAAEGDFEKNLDCCGWATKPVTVNGTVAHCSAACVTPGNNGTQNYDNCHTCKETVEDKIDYAFNSSGGVGLFFAFTEIIGTILAYRFRNLANPRITPPGNVYDSPPSGITIS